MGLWLYRTFNIAFLLEKIHSIGFDIDKEKIKSLNNGKINIYGLQKWLGFDVNKLNLNRFQKELMI